MPKTMLAGAALLVLALGGCGGGGSGGSSGWTHDRVAELESSLKSDATINAAGRECIVKGVESKVSPADLHAESAHAKEQVEAIARECALQYNTGAATSGSEAGQGTSTTSTPEEQGAEAAKQAEQEAAQEAATTPGAAVGSREAREQGFDEAERKADEIGGQKGEELHKAVEQERKIAIEAEQGAK
jgi:hypothetical protein